MSTNQLQHHHHQHHSSGSSHTPLTRWPPAPPQEINTRPALSPSLNNHSPLTSSKLTHSIPLPKDNLCSQQRNTWGVLPKNPHLKSLLSGSQGLVPRGFPVPEGSPVPVAVPERRVSSGPWLPPARVFTAVPPSATLCCTMLNEESLPPPSAPRFRRFNSLMKPSHSKRCSVDNEKVASVKGVSSGLGAPEDLISWLTQPPDVGDKDSALPMMYMDECEGNQEAISTGRIEERPFPFQETEEYREAVTSHREPHTLRGAAGDLGGNATPAEHTGLASEEVEKALEPVNSEASSTNDDEDDDDDDGNDLPAAAESSKVESDCKPSRRPPPSSSPSLGELSGVRKISPVMRRLCRSRHDSTPNLEVISLRRVTPIPLNSPRKVVQADEERMLPTSNWNSTVRLRESPGKKKSSGGAASGSTGRVMALNGSDIEAQTMGPAPRGMYCISSLRPIEVEDSNCLRRSEDVVESGEALENPLTPDCQSTSVSGSSQRVSLSSAIVVPEGEKMTKPDHALDLILARLDRLDRRMEELTELILRSSLVGGLNPEA